MRRFSFMWSCAVVAARLGYARGSEGNSFVSKVISGIFVGNGLADA
jgi:hypothetical protein